MALAAPLLDTAAVIVPGAETNALCEAAIGGDWVAPTLLDTVGLTEAEAVPDREAAKLAAALSVAA